MIMAPSPLDFRLPQYVITAPEGEEIAPLLSDDLASIIPEEALAHHLTYTKRFFPDAVVWHEEIPGS